MQHYNHTKISTITQKRLSKLNGLNKQKLLFFILLTIGALCRIMFLSYFPVGLNQDEASAGYETYALLNGGIDRNGQEWPMYFIAWGGGQNALYSYLSMPFIALLGLNVFSIRIMSALCGVFTLLVFYLLCKKLLGEMFGIISMGLLAICPWHIMISRWGLEVNILPFFILAGIYFVCLAIDRPHYLLIAVCMFALSFYTYAASSFFFIFFLPTCLIMAVKHKWYPVKWMILSIIVFLFLMLPFIGFLAVNYLGIPSFRIYGLTVPQLTASPHTRTTFLGANNLFQGLLDISKTIFRIFIWQYDGNIQYTIPGFGIFYLFALPFAMVGFVAMIKKKDAREWLILCAVSISLPLMILLRANINRMNAIYLPLLYCISVGVMTVAQRAKRNIIHLTLAYSISFLAFILVYFMRYGEMNIGAFYNGLGPAIQYASENTKGELIITHRCVKPYIHVLFHERIDSDVFRKTVQYRNKGDEFEEVDSFDRYIFRQPDDPILTDIAYVLYAPELNEYPIFIAGGYYLTRFGEYYAIIPK